MGGDNKSKDLNYLTEAELELSREEVNLQIATGLESCKTKAEVCELLDDVRAHENYVQKKALREQASQEIQRTLDFMHEMESLYAELKSVPWYRFSARRLVKDKINVLSSTKRRIRSDMLNRLKF